jgi:lysyl-tRNA synthetase class II
MGFVTLSYDAQKTYLPELIFRFSTTVTLKMRELDAELSQLSALRKSRQVVATRAARELLQNKVQNFTDARVATEAEHNFCSEKLAQPDFLCRSNDQHALATLGRDNEQLERFKDWVSGAETCLSHVQPPSRPNSPIKK